MLMEYDADGTMPHAFNGQSTRLHFSLSTDVNVSHSLICHISGKVHNA